MGLWILCFDLVTMTLGEDGDPEKQLSIDRMVGGP